MKFTICKLDIKILQRNMFKSITIIGFQLEKDYNNLRVWWGTTDTHGGNGIVRVKYKYCLPPELIGSRLRKNILVVKLNINVDVLENNLDFVYQKEN